jgi:hypothetical protein
MAMIKYFLLVLALIQSEKVNSFQFPSLTAPWGAAKVKPPSPEESLAELNDLIAQAPKNGIDTPADLEAEIVRVCQKLELANPTKAPAKSELMNGFWRLLWTNFAPAAPSSGKLGPLVGNVYQDLDFNAPFARNILKIDFPPIAGELFANPRIVNDSTVAITFVSVGNKLAGVVPFGPKIKFEEGKEVRLWEHIYLDDDYRILHARREEDTSGERGALFILKRAEEERFETKV